MADPYIQEAKKYTEPYIDRVAMVTKTHLDKLQERKCQCSSPCCKPGETYVHLSSQNLAHFFFFLKFTLSDHYEICLPSNS
ncbi:hypothetical protein ACFX2G_001563 [Malus domestica]